MSMAGSSRMHLLTLEHRRPPSCSGAVLAVAPFPRDGVGPPLSPPLGGAHLPTLPAGGRQSVLRPVSASPSQEDDGRSEATEVTQTCIFASPSLFLTCCANISQRGISRYSTVVSLVKVIIVVDNNCCSPFLKASNSPKVLERSGSLNKRPKESKLFELS